MSEAATAATTDHILTLKIDETGLPAPTPEAEQERNIAVFDLLEGNVFRLTGAGAAPGPHDVTLSARERRIIMDITPAKGAPVEIALPFSAIRKRAKEYFGLCDCYFEAVRSKSPDEIARLDEGRKALHNEGAAHLREKLAAQVEIDTNTARRLFTLMCSLAYRG